eukprot:scaffold56674_cov66-Phaeocystis_antarctica.AAC.2
MLPPLRRRLLQGGLPPAPCLRAVFRPQLLRTLECLRSLVIPLELLQARAPAVGRLGPAGREHGGALGISKRLTEPARPQVRERAVAQKHLVVGRERQRTAVRLVGGAEVAPAEGVVARRLVFERRLRVLVRGLGARPVALSVRLAVRVVCAFGCSRCMLLRRAAAAATAELRCVQRSGGRALGAVLQARWLPETVSAVEPEGVAHERELWAPKFGRGVG